jgi:hypothetical protein
MSPFSSPGSFLNPDEPGYYPPGIDATEQQFINTLKRYGIRSDSLLGKIKSTKVPFVVPGKAGNHCERWAQKFEMENDSTNQYRLEKVQWEIIDGTIWIRHVAIKITFRCGEVFYVDDGAIQFVNGNGDTVFYPHQISTEQDIPVNWKLGGTGYGAWDHFWEGVGNLFGF